MLEETVLGKTHYCIYCKDIKEPFIIGKCPQEDLRENILSGLDAKNGYFPPKQLFRILRML